MKSILRSDTVNPQASFTVRREVVHVSSVWHHHPEYELTLIRGGHGLEIIGDKTESLDGKSRITLIPPYLSHIRQYDTLPGEEEVDAISVRFRKDLFSRDFLKLPEMTPLHDLFDAADRGVRIYGQALKEVEPMMVRLYDAEYYDRFFILLRIIYTLGKRKEDYLPIAGYNFVQRCGEDDTESARRINQIFQYTFDNYRKQIKIDEVSELAGLSREAFCRYFKVQTGKTYIAFLTEVRIGFACKMLMQKDLDIQAIYRACGYNFSSNFYRQFLNIKGMTPLQYRRSYQSIDEQR